jgi:excisionase family DNA binding protein
MTVPAYVHPLGNRLPSDDEKAAANQLRQIIASHTAGASGTSMRVLGDDDRTSQITLGPALSELLLEMLRYIANGDAVMLVPVSQMLTTQQAADILNVSRPYLISLLEAGEIEHHKTGRHRRIKADNLFAYKKKRDADRADALTKLALLDAGLL